MISGLYDIMHTIPESCSGAYADRQTPAGPRSALSGDTLYSRSLADVSVQTTPCLHIRHSCTLVSYSYQKPLVYHRSAAIGLPAAITVDSNYHGGLPMVDCGQPLGQVL